MPSTTVIPNSHASSLPPPLGVSSPSRTLRPFPMSVIPKSDAESGRERDLTMLVNHHERSSDIQRCVQIRRSPTTPAAQSDVRSLSCPPPECRFGMTQGGSDQIRKFTANQCDTRHRHAAEL